MVEVTDIRLTGPEMGECVRASLRLPLRGGWARGEAWGSRCGLVPARRCRGAAVRTDVVLHSLEGLALAAGGGG